VRPKKQKNEKLIYWVEKKKNRG